MLTEFSNKLAALSDKLEKVSNGAATHINGMNQAHNNLINALIAAGVLMPPEAPKSDGTTTGAVEETKTPAGLRSIEGGKSEAKTCCTKEDGTCETAQTPAQ